MNVTEERTGSAGSAPRLVSVAIKTFNEERNIERCLDAALLALREIDLPWEIVVADSASTDRTVDLARAYPVTVVQLAQPEQRGCGAGVQLGFQHARGDLVLVLDADMELMLGFLPAAIARLQQDPGLGGVAGLNHDTTVTNAFDRRRVTSGSSSRVASNPPWLSGGGLYRRDAILQCGGYAGNRNLKAWEEAELGLRLTHGGWRLERMSIPAVLHAAHAASTWALLRAHWRSGRAMAYGVFLRIAMRMPWWPKVLRLMLPHLLAIAVWLFAFALFIGIGVGRIPWSWMGLYLLVCLAGFAVLCIKKRGVSLAILSVALWHYFGAALVLGWFQRTVSPTLPLPSKVLQRPQTS